MKRLFVLLMIALLPLRGWAGDVMGVQMAASGLASPSAGAMPADCPMKSLHASADSDADAAQQAPGGTEGCTSCDLCLPIAEPANLRFHLGASAVHAVPPMGGVAFFSALPALALKPPSI